MGFIDKSTFFIEEYLKGKDVHHVVVRVLNPLITVNLSSYLYQRLYGNYYWYDITDYKAIADFFIKGQYLIPLCIFLITNVALIVTTGLFISQFNTVIKKLTRSLYSSERKKVELTKKIIVGFDEKKIKRFLRRADDVKTELQETVHLNLKAIIVITIYYLSNSNFSNLLFAVTIIVLVALLVFYCFMHLCMEFFPRRIMKQQDIKANSADAADSFE